MSIKSFSLSLFDEENFGKFNTIEDFISFFKSYKKKPFIKDALRNMFINSGFKEKADEVTEHLYNQSESFINQNFYKIEKNHPKITKEDAIIICLYSMEVPSHFNCTPIYKLLNRCLTSEDRKKGIQNIEQYLLLLILALRKLEKFSNDILYRCLKTNVIKDIDSNGNKFKYDVGDTKKWWGFTSTSYQESVALAFLNGNYGTEFIIKKNPEFSPWGYDIRDFNVFGEKEILLLPEREIKIVKITPGNITKIECEIVTDKTSILVDCNECPNCGSLDNQRTNKINEINKDSITDLSEKLGLKTEKQINYLEEQMLKLFNQSNKKKYKCNECSHEYELDEEFDLID
jgi:hypothetical protein